MYATLRPAADLIREKGLEQVSDEAALAELVRRVLRANPKQVEKYCAGKKALFGFLVGEVMKASRYSGVEAKGPLMPAIRCAGRSTAPRSREPLEVAQPARGIGSGIFFILRAAW